MTHKEKERIFKDENSYSVQERTCQTCKHLFNRGSFPFGDPCVNCARVSHWEAHVAPRADDVEIEGVKKTRERMEEAFAKKFLDIVNHPPHYTNHPSGVECIQITEHMGFNLGNAMKYIWRADLKAKRTEDIEKAIWYLKRELTRTGGTDESNNTNDDDCCRPEDTDGSEGC